MTMRSPRSRLWGLRLRRISGAGQLAARRRIAKGDQKALAPFEAIAADTSFDEPFRSVAQLRAGLLAVDRRNYDQVKARLEPLAAAGNLIAILRARRWALRPGRPAPPKRRRTGSGSRRRCRRNQCNPQSRPCDARIARGQGRQGYRLNTSRRAAHGPKGSHRRPAQCRQIDPVQPAGRQAAGARRRHPGRHPRPARRRRPSRRPAISRSIDTAGLEDADADTLGAACARRPNAPSTRPTSRCS